MWTRSGRSGPLDKVFRISSDADCRQIVIDQVDRGDPSSMYIASLHVHHPGQPQSICEIFNWGAIRSFSYALLIDSRHKYCRRIVCVSLFFFVFFIHILFIHQIARERERDAKNVWKWIVWWPHYHLRQRALFYVAASLAVIPLIHKYIITLFTGINR